MPKPSWGGAAQGGLSGAASGMAIAGPWGALAGGIGGGLLGLFGGGSGPKQKQMSLQTKEQMELSKLITEGLKNGTGPFAELFNKEFDKEAFEKGVLNPQLKKFKDETLPMLQEKFIANNQVLTSAFGREQQKSGVDLQSKLAELMYTAQNAQQTRNDNNKLAGLNAVLGGGPKVENTVTPGSPGFGQTAMNAVANNPDMVKDAYKNTQDWLAKPATAPAQVTPATVG